jgi:general secretion pathway protein C
MLIGLVELGLLAAITFILARLIWLTAFGASAGAFEHSDPARASAPMRPAYIADLTRLRDADLFADRRAVAAAEPVQAAVQETQLNLTLRGIRRGATPDAGGAIIQTPDNRQRFFAAGAEILDGVALREVHVDHVLIDRRGVIESLYLRDDEGGASRASSSAPRRGGRDADQAPLRAGVQVIDGLFRAEPVREAGRVTGYRITQGNAVMLDAMGVRNGDVVTAVDGRPVSDISDLSAEFTRLRGRDRFSLSINRGGLPLSVQVELP